MDDFLDFLFGGGLEAGAGLGLLTGSYNRLGNLGDTAMSRAEQLGETALEQTGFRPYSVTTSGGSGFSAGPDGNYSINLGNRDQAMMNQLQGQALSNFYNSQNAGAGLSGAGNQLINAGMSGLTGGAPSTPPVGIGPIMPTGGMGTSGGANVPTPAQMTVGGPKNELNDQLMYAMSDGAPAPSISAPAPSVGGQLQNRGLEMFGRMPVGSPQMSTSSNNLLAAGQNLMGQPSTQGQALSNFGSGMLGFSGPAVTGAQGLAGNMAGAQGTSNNFMNQLNSFDQVGREQAVFDRMQAAMAPQRERDALSLENRLASQGRLGVATNQYGGTPEQLAQAKAFAEADNSAMLQAMGQAQAEQGQLAGIANQFGALGANQLGALSGARNQSAQTGLQGQQLGMNALNTGANLDNARTSLGINAIGAGQSGLFNNAQMRNMMNNQALAAIGTGSDVQNIESNIGLNTFNAGQNALLNSMALRGAEQDLGIGALNASYLPQAQLLNALSPGMTAAAQAQQAQMYGAGLNNEAIASGIEALLGAGQGQANLMGTVGSGLLAGANNSGGDEGNWLDLFRDWLS